MFTSPEEAEHAFYESLRHADLTAMMQVWADDDDIVCIHPGGVRLVGRAPIQNAWEQIFANGALFIKPLRPLVIDSVMSATHVLVEQVTIMTPQGRQTANCYTTNIFHKGPAGWRMVLHHTSSAPDDTGVFDLQDIPDILH